MKICLVGDISGDLDEGMKNTASYLSRELSKSNMVLQVRPKSLTNITKWKEVLSFSPQVIHYIHGPTIKSFVLTKFLSLLCPEAVTIISTPRPVISRTGLMLATLMKPNILLIQSSKQNSYFTQRGFRTHFFLGGVDTEKFRNVSEYEKQKIRKRFGIPNSKFIVLHVGHITPMRPLEMLAEIARDKSYFVYIVAAAATSWGKPNAKTFSLLKEAGCFINTNFIPEIEQVYQISDCYVFPGFGESPAIEIPLSVLEAMACNLAVVTGRFGGLSDLFTEGNGLYFADSTDEILQSLNRILHSNSEKIKTREVVKDLSWELLATKLMEIYQELIDEKGLSAA